MKSPCGKSKGSSLEFLPRWLVGGIIMGVLSLATGESTTAFTLPAWSNTMGWDDPSCYSTIQMADLDGDGRAELLGRCTSGIEAYWFDTTTGVWSPLPKGPTWSNEEGYNQEKYNLTIQIGDLDGDGKAELLARGAGGIVAYSYSAPKDHPTQGTWSKLPSGPGWSDAEGWSDAKYYLTIQTGDLNGDGKAELLARGPGGIVAYSYSGGTAGTWSRLPDGPSWTNSNGWDAASSYLTIQTGDLDGDGKAELLARSPEGIRAYTYSGGTAGTWSRLPDGPFWANKNGWDAASSYLTIQTGDLDGDGKAELLARGVGGILAYSYSGGTAGTWSRLPDGPSWANSNGWDAAEYYATIHTGNAIGKDHAVLIGRDARGVDTYEYTAGKWASTIAPFPQFTGEEAKAYQEINDRLLLANAHKTVRDTYSQWHASDLQNLKNSTYPGIKNQNQPPCSQNLIDMGTSPNAWLNVYCQIKNEITWAWEVANVYEENKKFLTPLWFTKKGMLQGVDITLNLEKDDSDKVTAVLSDLFSGVTEALGALPENVAMDVTGTLFASAVDAGTELGLNTDTLETEYGKLLTALVTNFEILETANTLNRRQIATTYGLLKTVGGNFENNIWQYPAGNLENTAVVLKEFTTFVWKTLSPAVWYTFQINNGGGGKYEHPIPNIRYSCYFGLTDSMGLSTWIDTSMLKTLFEKTSTQCQTTDFKPSCSLGLSLEEVYMDWSFRAGGGGCCGPMCGP